MCNLFEIVIIDLVPLSFTKYHYERLNENGMQTLAWAFIKVLGPNKIINIGSKLRLQLYKPHISKKKTSQLEVFRWWSSKPRISLPASLSISIEEYDISSVVPALRSMIPLQEEIGTSTERKETGIIDESAHEYPDQTHNISKKKREEVKWSRKEGESYEIPIQHSLSLQSSANCQILKFSSLGRLLVCGCGVLGQHFLFFYDIPSGKLIHKILAHSDVIYDLDWSEDDENLISASADYCVKLWNIKLWKLICAFVHPSFVYSAKFQPTLKDILVTGCYDHVIRIWNYNKSAQLLQELEGHNVAVNSLCWNKKTMKLFSADSAGKIKVWKVQHQRNASKGFVNYELEKDLNFPEIKGISVDKIIIPVSGNALFLFCGDAIIRLVDLSVGRIFICYEFVPKSHNIKGCCSPCGNLLFLCNDDGHVLAWKRESFEIAAVLPNNYHHCPLTSIDYHPLDHILALSTIEDSEPIHVYIYKKLDEDVASKESNISDQSKASTSDNHASKNTALNYRNKEKNTNIISTDIWTSSHSPLKTKKELKNDLRQEKNTPPKNYLYNVETSSDEGFAKLSLRTLDMKRDSSDSVLGPAGYEKSNFYHAEKSNSESLTAIVSKSGRFDIITVGESNMESDNHLSSSQISQTGNSDVLQRSSKRSQRRKKLREMNKTIL
ncbi:hypothetical protein CDAR_427551 [Caerostris darwini]|uniref:Jouberin n=1 Tax=Caerostris darwini TaxID=1538125 RepID=A0AAV4WVD6_9ARAC|nr:hypothetical protein CDAR_427551 [Caerostris darwini]